MLVAQIWIKHHSKMFVYLCWFNWFLVWKAIADWRIVYRSKKSSICKFKKYLLIKELSANRSVIFGSNKCLQNKRAIFRLLNCVQTKGWLHWQIEEWSADQRSIQSAGRINNFGSKNYLQIEVWSVEWRSICSADWRSICRSKNCLEIEEVFGLQIEELSADWAVIFKWKICLQT